MSFSYVDKIGLGDDLQIRKHDSTWRGLIYTKTEFDLERSFRYVNKIRLGEDFQIRKQNST